MLELLRELEFGDVQDTKDKVTELEVTDEGPIAHALSGRAPLDRKPTDFGVRSAPAESAIDEDDSALSPTACFEGTCFGEALEVESMPSMCGATGGVREIELAAHTKSKTTVEL